MHSSRTAAHALDFIDGPIESPGDTPGDGHGTRALCPKTLAEARFGSDIELLRAIRGDEALAGQLQRTEVLRQSSSIRTRLLSHAVRVHTNLIPNVARSLERVAAALSTDRPSRPTSSASRRWMPLSPRPTAATWSGSAAARSTCSAPGSSSSSSATSSATPRSGTWMCRPGRWRWPIAGSIPSSCESSPTGRRRGSTSARCSTGSTVAGAGAVLGHFRKARRTRREKLTSKELHILDTLNPPEFGNSAYHVALAADMYEREHGQDDF